MAKERLSRLQKGIILVIYGNDHIFSLPGIKRKVSILAVDGKSVTNCTGNALHVTVMRSIWNLAKKGLVMVFGGVSRSLVIKMLPTLDKNVRDHFERMLKAFPDSKKLVMPIDKTCATIFKVEAISLHSRAIVLARQWLNVKPGVNNKKKRKQK